MRRPENVTEANLAKVFAVYLQGKALYCFDDKHWYLWNGQRWQKDKQNQIIDTCLQLHGGAGYMDEYPISRMYKDARVQSIYGGTNEIMKELISRTL